MRKALTVTLGLSLSCTPLVAAGPRAIAAPATLLQDYDEGEGEDSSEGEAFSHEQLENLLAPIALYPDPLLAQVLLAATFVDQVDEAARYVRAYGEAGIDDGPWDVSVKAVARYPVVLSYLADHIDWTAALGQAYVAQSTDVMMSVQRLRQMALSQGNLQTTYEQEVMVEDDYVRIVPAQPRLIFVPRYSPAIVYHRRPSSGLAISFGVGLAIGAWLNDDFDWRGHRVYYHGWSGDGWIGRSRPHVRMTSVYVDNRYSGVVANRKILDRNVSYWGLNRYNSVHRNVTYDNVRFHRNLRIKPRAFEGRAYPGNAIINRNMNTRDPRLDRYRGRPVPNVRLVPPNPPGLPPLPPAVGFVRPSPPGSHAYGKAEGGFDPIVASRRGQASREAAKATGRSSERKKKRRQ